MQDMKLTDQYARHEIAGHENTGHEKAQQKTSIFIAVILINCNLAYAFSTYILTYKQCIIVFVSKKITTNNYTLHSNVM